MVDGELEVDAPTPLIRGVYGLAVGLDREQRIWINTYDQVHLLLPAQ